LHKCCRKNERGDATTSPFQSSNGSSLRSGLLMQVNGHAIFLHLSVHVSAFVCMHVCMCLCVCACVYARVHVCVCLYLCTCLCMCVYVCMDTCMCVKKCVCTCACVCKCVSPFQSSSVNSLKSGLLMQVNNSHAIFV